jgi:hypothetical protein
MKKTAQDTVQALQTLLAEAERLRSTHPDTAAFIDSVIQAISARELGETMPGGVNPRSAMTLADEFVKQAESGRIQTAELIYQALLVATSRRIAAGEFESKSLDEFRKHLAPMSKEALVAFHQQILLDLHTLNQAKLGGQEIGFSPGFKMSKGKLVSISKLCNELGSAETYAAGGGEGQ